MQFCQKIWCNNFWTFSVYMLSVAKHVLLKGPRYAWTVSGVSAKAKGAASVPSGLLYWAPSSFCVLRITRLVWRRFLGGLSPLHLFYHCRLAHKFYLVWPVALPILECLSPWYSEWLLWLSHQRCIAVHRRSLPLRCRREFESKWSEMVKLKFGRSKAIH